jgi:hypothetical protein
VRVSVGRLSAGPDALDVGCGNPVAARRRLAEFARRSRDGLAVGTQDLLARRVSRQLSAVQRQEERSIPHLANHIASRGVKGRETICALRTFWPVPSSSTTCCTSWALAAAARWSRTRCRSGLISRFLKIHAKKKDAWATRKLPSQNEGLYRWR